MDRSSYSEAAQAWGYWLKNVFMPINRKMLDAILSKADLIDGIELPQCLIDFCAHVTGYEVTLAQWEDGDFSNLGSIVNHPGVPFSQYVEANYQELKKKQTALLNSNSHKLAEAPGGRPSDETQTARARIRRAGEARKPAKTRITATPPSESGNDLTE